MQSSNSLSLNHKALGIYHFSRYAKSYRAKQSFPTLIISFKSTVYIFNAPNLNSTITLKVIISSECTTLISYT